MLTGAILAGGKSRRYGRNKALEVFQGERLIDRGVASLRPLCSPILVVANELDPYLDVRATLVQDVIAHQGPLGGIRTALHFSPHDWVLVKATDMPILAPEVPRMMLERREGYDAVVPVCNGLYEPLLALYHRRCLPAIIRTLEEGELKVVAFFRKVKLMSFPEDLWRTVDPEGSSFKNINSPADWGGLTNGPE